MNALLDRRTALMLLAGAPLAFSSARAQAPAMSKLTAFAFSFNGLDGANIKLADYAGKPILIVNTASQCGYTPQFTGLQQLWAQFHERGLMIVAVPSNDFGGQEPGDASAIADTARNLVSEDGKVAPSFAGRHTLGVVPFLSAAIDAAPVAARKLMGNAGDVAGTFIVRVGTAARRSGSFGLQRVPRRRR